MFFLKRLFGGAEQRRSLDPLYRAIVATARNPAWYRAGGVPDTLDGRFDMVAAVTALVMLRLEAETGMRETTVLLTERFIEDMDANLRQSGIGDYVVGKHVGRLMSALGGRIAAFRTAANDDRAFANAVRLNIFHDDPPSAEALDWVVERLARFRRQLTAEPVRELLAGRMATP